MTSPGTFIPKTYVPTPPLGSADLTNDATPKPDIASIPSTHPLFSASQRPFSTRLQSNYPMYNGAKHNNRPASIATGHLDHRAPDKIQRPGSLALGTLADSALLNRLPRDRRPGSLAAPINTLGIPPAPTRAVSHMGLNVIHPKRSQDHFMFRSQDLSQSERGWTPDRRHSNDGAGNQQKNNDLVSIIDQVRTYTQHRERCERRVEELRCFSHFV